MTGASPVTTLLGLAWLATQWRVSRRVVTGLAPVMPTPPIEPIYELVVSDAFYDTLVPTVNDDEGVIE